MMTNKNVFIQLTIEPFLLCLYKIKLKITADELASCSFVKTFVVLCLRQTGSRKDFSPYTKCPKKARGSTKKNCCCPKVHFYFF